MLCLSGFEPYSRWVPLVSVAQQEIASFINTYTVDALISDHLGNSAGPN